MAGWAGVATIKANHQPPGSNRRAGGIWLGKEGYAVCYRPVRSD